MIVGVDIAAFTVIADESTEFAVCPVPDAESVTRTFALIGELVIHWSFVVKVNELLLPNWFARMVFEMELNTMKL